MNSQFFYHVTLVTHIIGITMLAGTTLISYITSKYFWWENAQDKEKGMVVIRTISKFQKFNGLGLLLLIASGVTMMVITHGVYGEQVWFRIKFGLILLVIANAIGIGRRLGKLKDAKKANTTEMGTAPRFIKLKSNIQLFYIIQLGLFVTVFILSVFKFN